MPGTVTGQNASDDAGRTGGVAVTYVVVADVAERGGVRAYVYARPGPLTPVVFTEAYPAEEAALDAAAEGLSFFIGRGDLPDGRVVVGFPEPGAARRISTLLSLPAPQPCPERREER